MDFKKVLTKHADNIGRFEKVVNFYTLRDTRTPI
jgi:hypothetical protein